MYFYRQVGTVLIVSSAVNLFQFICNTLQFLCIHQPNLLNYTSVEARKGKSLIFRSFILHTLILRVNVLPRLKTVLLIFV